MIVLKHMISRISKAMTSLMFKILKVKTCKKVCLLSALKEVIKNKSYKISNQLKLWELLQIPTLVQRKLRDFFSQMKVTINQIQMLKIKLFQ
jgi:hypothetical protein